jgi:hypothetical protein
MLLIIPKSLVEELRSLPEHRLSQRQLIAYVSLSQFISNPS